ncbi:dual-specificity RNA methyltransferase RlmN [Alphaproteobacteria bacterium]|nr:dual-specificity RNA methyltransferase RlmN [Alphaproteobacteria bacterium]GHS99998.1 dual-specificity RNA methyltransferase RlmN [Alphaproteobacteria bacterium]
MAHSLFDFLKPELSQVLTEKGYPSWRAQQIWEWLYQKGALSFEEMSNLPQNMRAFLAENFLLQRPVQLRHEVSKDKTEKWRLVLEDGNSIEMVLIPEEERERNTLCVSSQVGCGVRCAFCFTGTMGFVRNLEAHEIVSQILLARDFLKDVGSAHQKRTLTNIVLMGMGEPLHNYSNISKALQILMDPSGLAFSKRRITLSTAGVVPFMKKCGEELGVNLAVSLHAPNDAIRSRIIPLNQHYPLAQLMDVCRNYPGINTARRLTFEYVMLKDVNDSKVHAKELVGLIQGIPAKINLIPWNPWPDAHFETSPFERIEAFQNVLENLGVPAFLRTPRGQDISAACGQLK